jgi:hypothetical protein
MSKLFWTVSDEFVKFIGEYADTPIDKYAREMGRMIYYQGLLSDSIRKYVIDISDLVDDYFSYDNDIITLTSSNVTLCAVDPVNKILHVNTWFICAIFAMSDELDVVRSVLEFIELNSHDRIDFYMKYPKTGTDVNMYINIQKTSYLVDWLKRLLEIKLFDLNDITVLTPFIEQYCINITVDEIRKILNSFDIDIGVAIKKIRNAYDEKYNTLQTTSLESVIGLNCDMFNNFLNTFKKLYRVKFTFNVKFIDYID